MTHEQAQRIVAEMRKLMEQQEHHTTTFMEKVSYPTVKKEEQPFTVSGIAVEYNRKDFYNQITLPGCLAKWLQEPQCIPLLFMHEQKYKVGEVSRFTDTEKGLFIEATLDDTPIGRDMERLIKAGVLESLSAQVRFKKDLNERNPQTGIQYMKELVGLGEISLVLIPAAPGTMLTTATKELRETTYREYEDRLANFCKVQRKLEVKEIHDLIYEEWRIVYNSMI